MVSAGSVLCVVLLTLCGAAVFIERQAASSSNKHSGGVTFSGLLNAIDGVASQVATPSPTPSPYSCAAVGIQQQLSGFTEWMKALLANRSGAGGD